MITSLPLFLLSTTAPPTPSPSTLIVPHTCKDCSQCHNLLVRIFEHIIPLWLDQWKLGSKILENPWKCQRWKSCLSLLQSVEVGPSGRQQRRNERAVTKYICIILPFMVSLTFNWFQRTFIYASAVSSKCLLKEAHPKSLLRYFPPKTIQSSQIDFHS